MTLPRTFKQWIKTLAASVIGGAANAVLAALGIQAGSVLGEHVTPLELRQIEHIAISGAVIGACLFLAKSPVPPDNGNTKPPFKTIIPNDGYKP